MHSHLHCSQSGRRRYGENQLEQRSEEQIDWGASAHNVNEGARPTRYMMTPTRAHEPTQCSHTHTAQHANTTHTTCLVSGYITQVHCTHVRTHTPPPLPPHTHIHTNSARETCVTRTHSHPGHQGRLVRSRSRAAPWQDLRCQPLAKAECACNVNCTVEINRFKKVT